jgi:hypothetical protein
MVICVQWLGLLHIVVCAMTCCALWWYVFSDSVCFILLCVQWLVVLYDDTCSVTRCAAYCCVCDDLLCSMMICVQWLGVLHIVVCAMTWCALWWYVFSDSVCCILLCVRWLGVLYDDMFSVTRCALHCRVCSDSVCFMTILYKGNRIVKKIEGIILGGGWSGKRRKEFFSLLCQRMLWWLGKDFLWTAALYRTKVVLAHDRPPARLNSDAKWQTAAVRYGKYSSQSALPVRKVPAAAAAAAFLGDAVSPPHSNELRWPKYLIMETQKI